MVVKTARGIAKAGGSEEGQSLLEFLLMLPMMLGLVAIMVKVNTAIQISINNQQYARAQTLFLAGNSATYPNVRLRELELVAKRYNQMVIGVSENSTDTGESRIKPVAATYYVARRKGQPKGEAGAEPRERALVRVRDTVTLCTQPNVVSVNGAMAPIVEMRPGQGGRYTAVGPSQLNEGTRFDYCASPLKYESGSSDEGES